MEFMAETLQLGKLTCECPLGGKRRKQRTPETSPSLNMTVIFHNLGSYLKLIMGGTMRALKEIPVKLEREGWVEEGNAAICEALGASPPPAIEGTVRWRPMGKAACSDGVQMLWQIRRDGPGCRAHVR